jgi:DNA-binding winged helix-turn-helix (wHTH) protein
LDLRGAPVRFCFGDFVLDDEARRLTRDGEPVMLTPKAFELLAYLVERHPKAVTKAQIHDRIWPVTFVAEVNLHALINEVRRALGDDARTPRFVRTVRGFGYAFDDTVRRLPADEPRGAGSAKHRLVWQKREFPLEPGDNVVGRTHEAQVWIDHASVSRRHAVVHVCDDGVFLADCGSKNGSYVDGRRINQPTPLRDGMEIRLGKTLLVFRAFSSEGSTASVTQT